MACTLPSLGTRKKSRMLMLTIDSLHGGHFGLQIAT